MSFDQNAHIPTPPFSRKEIIKRAEDFIGGYLRSIDRREVLLGISFDVVYENYIYPEFGIRLDEGCQLGFDDSGEKILGQFEVETNRVLIDECIGVKANDGRRVFTLWHEVGGHGVLQGDWLRTHLQRVKRLTTTDASVQLSTADELEYQANVFAGHAGVPSNLLLYFLKRRLGIDRPIRYIGPGTYQLMVQDRLRSYSVSDQLELCRILASHVKRYFGGMSTEAISYRIAECGIVKDAERTGFRMNRVGSRKRSGMMSLN